MGAKTNIEWSEATWNPVVGCTKVSAGCDHCYAETLVNRFAGHNKGFPNRFDVVTQRPHMLELPLKWKTPKRIFVNSLSDLFHADVPTSYVLQVFAVMSAAEHHTFQLLTKRHARMHSLLSSPDFGLDVAMVAENEYGGSARIWPLPNLHLVVSVEDQHWAGIRIPVLLDTPAAVRGISVEPMLGPVVLRPEWLHSRMCPMRSGGPLCACIEGDTRLDWVIVGGESGKDARPMRPRWAREIRDQCLDAGVPFLFKQWGEFAPARAGEAWQVGEEFWSIWRYGKKAAGRELDGRTWDEYPVGAH